MNEFNKFTENLMKVVLVPDETSDAIEEVTPTTPDVFTQTTNSVLDDIEDSEGSCGCEGEDSWFEDSGEEESEDDSDFTVTHDTTGLKVTMNGIDFTLPNEVVEKIKEVLEPDSEEDYEEEEEEEIESPCSGSDDEEEVNEMAPVAKAVVGGVASGVASHITKKALDKKGQKGEEDEDDEEEYKD